MKITRTAKQVQPIIINRMLGLLVQSVDRRQKTTALAIRPKGAIVKVEK